MYHGSSKEVCWRIKGNDSDIVLTVYYGTSVRFQACLSSVGFHLGNSLTNKKLSRLGITVYMCCHIYDFHDERVVEQVWSRKMCGAVALGGWLMKCDMLQVDSLD